MAHYASPLPSSQSLPTCGLPLREDYGDSVPTLLLTPKFLPVPCCSLLPLPSLLFFHQVRGRLVAPPLSSPIVVFFLMSRARLFSDQWVNVFDPHMIPQPPTRDIPPATIVVDAPPPVRFSIFPPCCLVSPSSLPSPSTSLSSWLRRRNRFFLLVTVIPLLFQALPNLKWAFYHKCFVSPSIAAPSKRTFGPFGHPFSFVSVILSSPSYPPPPRDIPKTSYFRILAGFPKRFPSASQVLFVRRPFFFLACSFMPLYLIPSRFRVLLALSLSVFIFVRPPICLFCLNSCYGFSHKPSTCWSFQPFLIPSQRHSLQCLTGCLLYLFSFLWVPPLKFFFRHVLPSLPVPPLSTPRFPPPGQPFLASVAVLFEALACCPMCGPLGVCSFLADFFFGSKTRLSLFVYLPSKVSFLPTLVPFFFGFCVFVWCDFNF